MTSRGSASRPTQHSAAAQKVAVQPNVRSDQLSGHVLAIPPAIPDSAVSWVTNVTRDSGNQDATILRTLMKIIASPQPSNARAARAGPNDVTVAKQACAAHITSSPLIRSLRGPNRSM